MADIKDTEIRIIGDNRSYKPARKNRRFLLIAAVVIAVAALVAVPLFVMTGSESPAEVQPVLGESLPVAASSSPRPIAEAEEIEGAFEILASATSPQLGDSLLFVSGSEAEGSYCLVRETSVNDIPFRIYLPQHASPELHIGKIDSKDPSIVLALQAADIRKDNGQIVGACVEGGKIRSTSLSKKGYVAIIGGKVSVGVSENSPLFEEAVSTQGDFFRQYPLVSERQIVENNPKNLSIRRAICERKGRVFVAESLVPLSFHDFSQLLVDFQVDNAVYLVGSSYACGFMRDKVGELNAWGESRIRQKKNISYLVWRKQ